MNKREVFGKISTDDPDHPMGHQTWRWRQMTTFVVNGSWLEFPLQNLGTWVLCKIGFSMVLIVLVGPCAFAFCSQPSSCMFLEPNMGWVRVLCSDLCLQTTVNHLNSLRFDLKVLCSEFMGFSENQLGFTPKELCSVSWGIFMRCHMHIHFKPSIFGYPHDYGNLHIQSCFNDGKFCDTSC